MGLGGAPRRGRAVAAAVAAVALAVSGCGLTEDGAAQPETKVRSVEEARVGPPTTVKVDRHRFVTRCAGERDQPAVVLVAPEGTPMSVAWARVQGRIGTFARVCAYDRLGVGRSGEPPSAQTFADMAADLRGVVDQLGLEPPVLLVGASLGGLVAATLAAQEPDLVSDLVLLDVPGPGYPQALIDRLPAKGKGSRERAAWRAWQRPGDNREHLAGRRAFAEAEVLRLPGDVALLALTHSIAEHPRSTSPKQQADLESAWEAGQNHWLSQSSTGRLERVDLAGHDIARDRPDVVVERVRELLPGGKQ